jgi:HD-GYP domain-containing protein (c-di-GMP phosphodiesterase class II)
MVMTLTATGDPLQTWQQKALLVLEETLCQPLNVWHRDASEKWELAQRDSCRDQDPTEGNIEDNTVEISVLLESASIQSRPFAGQVASGEYLCVVPLGERMAVTTTTYAQYPELVVKLATVSQQYFLQEVENARLREENDFFLKQVSDDFEELTFLRSMAEKLGLGDSTHTIEQLVKASLPELGKSAHAEELHYIQNTPKQLKLLVSWHTDPIQRRPLHENIVLQLMDSLRQTALSQPAIKNGIEHTAGPSVLAGVRDYIAVPVLKSDKAIGWFLAINRLAECSEEEAQDYPEWRLNQHEFGTSEASLLSTAAAMTASHANNLSLFNERETLLVNVVRTLVSAVEAKDQYTCGHSERVAIYAKRLAQQAGYSKKDCELFYLTGLLHDIGKIAINDAILNKPDRLTDEEFAEIQRHPAEGWKILQELEQLNYVLPGVLHHHERFDGKGYPDGLSGLDIPLDGRILAVADAYDAMTSNRAYRTGMPHEKAMGILRDGAGTQWDPEAVEAFMQIEQDIISMRETYTPRDKPNRVPTQPQPPTQ